MELNAWRSRKLGQPLLRPTGRSVIGRYDVDPQAMINEGRRCLGDHIEKRCLMGFERNDHRAGVPRLGQRLRDVTLAHSDAAADKLVVLLGVWFCAKP